MKETKEHILSVSFGLFLQKSYKEVTLKDIVETSGLSKGAFYHYFSSKEQIFREILDSTFSGLVEVDFQKITSDSLFSFYRSYIASLDRKYVSFQSTVTGGTFDLNYYSIIFDAMRFFPDFREKMLQANKAERAVWEAVIRAARESSEIRSPMSDSQIASMFIHSAGGVGMDFTIQGAIERTTATLSELWDGFYAALKA